MKHKKLIYIFLFFALAILSWIILSQRKVSDFQKFPLDDYSAKYEIQCESNQYWLIYMPTQKENTRSISILESEVDLFPYCGQQVIVTGRFADYYQSPLCINDQLDCGVDKVPGVILQEVDKFIIKGLTYIQS